MTTQRRKLLVIAIAVIAAAAASVAIGVAAVRGDEEETPVSSSDTSASSTGQLQGIRGTVRSAEGNPIAGALITPTSLDVPAKAIPELAVLSQDGGRYEWTLDPGKYEISVSADGYQTQTKTVSVERGGAATLDFVLQPS